MIASKTIKERRTIRKFNASPVPQELILSLLDEAASLYEAEGSSSWRCIYYDTLESRQRLANSMIAKINDSSLGKLIPGKMTELLTKQAVNIPAHLVFIAEAADTPRQRDQNYAAVCSIMQNLQLLGWEHELGMLWYTDPMLTNPSFLDEIGLQAGERFAGILHIGYFDKTPKARKRTPAERNWTVMSGGDTLPSHQSQVSPQAILELLNEAVWAPNDGLREPWRFIYIAGGEAVDKLWNPAGDASSSFLLMVAKEESDSHKQEEDYAAVCCLIQNFQLLARAKPWQVHRLLPEWIYDQKRCEPLGIRPKETIVAVLELGLGGELMNSNLAQIPQALNITQL